MKSFFDLGGQGLSRGPIRFGSKAFFRRRPAQIVDRAEAVHVRLDVSDRRPLGDARLVHEQSEAGAIRGRVLLIPER
jgi:hypothetical protein